MKLVIIGALSLVFSAWVVPAGAAPGDALTSSRSVYESLVSYADTGVISFYQGRRVTRTLYRAPRRFYMEVTQETDALRSSWRYVLWCDGADFESWDSSSGSHTVYGRDEAAIARALTDLASRASSAAVVVPSLLLAAPARVPDHYAITLSVDPTTKLIHAALFDLVPGISAIRDPTFRITLQPRANPALDADSFHFEVPLP